LSIEDIGLLLEVVACNLLYFLNNANVGDVLQRCGLLLGEVTEELTEINA
jgi:hypothetical protein